VAECFWPDVAPEDLVALDRRLREATGRLGPERPLRYLGSMLLRDDDVVLCEFVGSAEAIRAVAQAADVFFERILETVRTGSGEPR
jgi:hypothetical protein